MKLLRNFATTAATALTLSVPLAASASICDYRPSNLLGGAGAGAAVTTGGAVAAVGVGAKAAGFYTLTHAVTGATMLGSAAGGASAAGTVGIMGGTAGLVGTAASILMAPVTIISGAVIGGGIAVYEGGCYFAVERTTNPEVIDEILQNLTANADPERLRLAQDGEEQLLLIANSRDSEGRALNWDKYKVSNLYIEEGMLKHSDWGINSNIGLVGFTSSESSN